MSGADTSPNGNCEAGLLCIHVAILELQNDSVWVMDATIKRGVDRYPLDDFFQDFTLKDGSLPVFKVMRLKDNSRAGEFVQNAKKYLGLPYDVYFLPDNDAMYCSELVRDSYVIPDTGCIFSSAPINFKNSAGEFPLYWEQLFGLLGQKIPQDNEGTTPEAMSKEDALRAVDVDLTSYALQAKSK